MAEIMQYIRKDGIFHRLSALTKIVLLVLVVAISILTTEPAVLAGIVIVLFLLSVAGNLYRELIGQIPMLIFLSAGLLLLTVCTMQSGETLTYLIPPMVPFIGGSLPVTSGALTFAAVLSLRFFAMLFVFQLVIISTQPRDLVHALQKIRLPVDYSLMLLIALRFIPALQLEGKRIQEAQLARAYNPGGGFIGKIKSLSPIAIPLVSNSLGKANVLGLTIDLRGLRTHPGTPMTERDITVADIAALCLMALILAGFCAFIVL